MRYVVEIEQVLTIPMVVDAHTEREARVLAAQALQSTKETDPETVGDPVAEAPSIRRVRMQGV